MFLVSAAAALVKGGGVGSIGSARQWHVGSSWFASSINLHLYS